ncbi:MAG: ammonium transporter [Candidatus Bathyarchaeota archaeon]|nr:ammonium transporter [Candidatus Bathyarchaeota archaeon]
MSAIVTNSGDIAWVITATALVMIMTPALGFFYGGLVRKKNLVSTIAQCFIIFAVMSIVWALWGYSLAFGPSFNGVIGNLSLFALNGIGVDTVTPLLAPTIPTLLFFAFQLKFAAITPALIIGACAERVRFKSLLLFIILWSTFIYVPVAHWVWSPDGWLKALGSIDFAGGLVVHITAGVSALAAALVVGRRKGETCPTGATPTQGSSIPWKEHMKSLDLKLPTFKPTNIPYVLLGAALLWFGWFGFNAGSALAANNLAVSALVVTNLAAAAAAISWMAMDWLLKGKPSAVGMAVGAVVGLVVITPASGFVTPSAAIIMGLIGGVISNLIANWRTGRSRIDDSLDVFACHGVGGIWGAIGTGIFASIGATGLLYGGLDQFLAQLAAVAVVVPLSFFGSYALLKLVNLISPLRVSEEAEESGLDLSEHGEEAYQLD